ncbi:MAG: hypothetical protein LBQ89_01980 [Treponema sp.]|jgi:hypothetical protein|nr:hypothetical protein [Treponema sp.]
MEGQKVLIGDDSMIFTGDPGDTEYSGDGQATVAGLTGIQPGTLDVKRIMCVITAIGEDSIFPDGLVLGDLFPSLGTEIPAQGDKFKVLALSHVADASSWSLSITQGEIDVTRLNDRFRKYRLGKKDAQLSLSSIFTVGESDQPGGIINRNMKLVSQDKNGNYTVSDEANRALYMLGYVNRAALPEETDDFVFCQIYLYNAKLGGQSGSAQSYDASGRLTGMDPVFYSLEAQSA